MLILGDIENNGRITILYDNDESEEVKEIFRLTRNDVIYTGDIDVMDINGRELIAYSVNGNADIKKIYDSFLSKNTIKLASKKVNIPFFKNLINVPRKDVFEWIYDVWVYKNELKNIRQIIGNDNIGDYRHLLKVMKFLTNKIDIYKSREIEYSPFRYNFFIKTHLSNLLENNYDIGMTHVFSVYNTQKWENTSDEDKFEFIINSLYISLISNYIVDSSGEIINKNESSYKRLYLETLMRVYTGTTTSDTVKFFILREFNNFIEKYNEEVVIKSINKLKKTI